VPIDDGRQWFSFQAYVRTLYEAPTDTARILVEYRDLNNLVVLDSFDTGDFSSPGQWSWIADERPAPVGTAWIRVRLIANYLGDAYFDALSLNSLRAPTIVVDDLDVYEGDVGFRQELFSVRLACPYAEEVTVDFTTTDQTAVAGEDYLANTGTAVLPVGETAYSIPVDVVGDEVDEPHETFSVDLSNAQPPEAILLDDQGVCLIFNDDFCAQDTVYWVNRPELWPVTTLEIGGVAYDQPELLELLGYRGNDLAHELAAELIATKLNLLRGSDPSIQSIVDTADAFLAQYPPGSRPSGAAKQEARNLIRDLSDYNAECAGRYSRTLGRTATWARAATIVPSRR
jgi:hypothetical protein